MSVDDRIRDALGGRAEAYVPSVETSLRTVRSRGRRARWRASVVATTGVAAAGLVSALVWGQVTDPPARPTPADSPTPSGSEPARSAPLRGLVTARVDGPSDLAGRWALQLNGNGSMDVEAPPGYPGVVAGALFTADGTTMRTTVLGEDVCAGDGTGIYEWLAVADRIELTVVSDPCRARVRFFEEPVWTWSTDRAARR